jgi:hypothetical protein
MSFLENLKAKIQLDRLVQQILSTMRETPGQRRLDKKLTKTLLEATDVEHRRARDLDLYVRPLEGEIMEVLVFDNELAIYHSTVEDVAMRRSPDWKEMFSFRNIKKILNDQDVVVSKGKESIRFLHSSALTLLDLSYTKDDLAQLVKEASLALESRSLVPIEESLDLFFELLDYQAVSVGMLEDHFQVFARPKTNGGEVARFEHPVVLNEQKLSVSLKKGSFSPRDDLDLAWLMQCAQGEKVADLENVEVFNFLAKLALEKAVSSTQ